MTGQLADRVMRARKESACLACGRLVKPGDSIARVGTWIHVHCAIERQRQHQDQEDE